MSLEITGKLIVKYEPQEFGEKKFKTREFVLELTEEVSGNPYTNYAKMQLVQNKCEIIDRFNIGDMVKVSFNIRGRSYQDKKDGSTKYISNMDAWRIEAAGANTGAGNPAPAPAYNTAGNSGPNNYNAAPAYNTATETKDDLPF